MATLVTRITDLATRIATEFKSVRTSIAAQINDTTASGTTTYSSNKINNLVTSTVSNLVNGAPTALDTLKELADAIGDDANFAATMTTGLGNRVRFDAAQTLTAPQKVQVHANIDAFGSVEIGTPDTDLVAVFNAGLV